jgi:branched-subunit amino acid aminotransferase/4-amino-4-deoxychorismate lyase
VLPKYLFNTDGMIIETLASNLFWIKDRILFTSTVSSGCVDGVMRGVVLEVAGQLGLHITQVHGVGYDELKGADEIFVTNAIHGINWIVGIDEQRYYNTLTIEIYKALSRKVKEGLI